MRKCMMLFFLVESVVSQPAPVELDLGLPLVTDLAGIGSQVLFFVTLPPTLGPNQVLRFYAEWEQGNHRYNQALSLNSEPDCNWKSTCVNCASKNIINGLQENASVPRCTFYPGMPYSWRRDVTEFQLLFFPLQPQARYYYGFWLWDCYSPCPRNITILFELVNVTSLVAGQKSPPLQFSGSASAYYSITLPKLTRLSWLEVKFQSYPCESGGTGTCGTSDLYAALTPQDTPRTSASLWWNDPVPIPGDVRTFFRPILIDLNGTTTADWYLLLAAWGGCDYDVKLTSIFDCTPDCSGPKVRCVNTTGDCACLEGYHGNWTECRINECEDNETQTCVSDFGSGESTCAGLEWGACVMSRCYSGYHVEGGFCVADERSWDPIIIGCLLGAVVVLLCVVACCFCKLRRHRKGETSPLL